MKNWNDFLQEFVLQAMTRAEVTSVSDEDYYLRVSIRMAREAWDAIQAAELPESEKAKNEAVAQSLKDIARRALKVSDNTAKWFAIDADGEMSAYCSAPYIDRNKWVFDQGNSYLLGVIHVPPDLDDKLMNRCFEISKILSNDIQ